MTFDLYLWKFPVVTEPDEAAELLGGWRESGDASAFEPSRDLVGLYRELVARHPTFPDFVEDDWEAAWRGIAEPSERLLYLHMSRSVPDEALDTLEELAGKYAVILYDPQGPTVITGKEVPIVGRQPGEIAQAIRGGLVGVALFVGGFLLRIPFIRWVMMIVGAFMVVMALYSLVVLFRMAPAKASPADPEPPSRK